ncbi:prominin, partial [Clonorchis sinensis]
MISPHWNSIVILFPVLLCCGSSDPSVSTMLQLRDSAEFSYTVTNLFLDLIRGNAPPTVVLEVYTNVMS